MSDVDHRLSLELEWIWWLQDQSLEASVGFLMCLWHYDHVLLLLVCCFASAYCALAAVLP